MLYEVYLVSTLLAFSGMDIGGVGYDNSLLFEYTYYNELENLSNPYEQTLGIEYLFLGTPTVLEPLTVELSTGEIYEVYLDEDIDINNDSYAQKIYLDMYETFNKQLQPYETIKVYFDSYVEALCVFHFTFTNSYYFDTGQEIDTEEIYNNGYAIGMNEGYNVGYQNGYNVGSSQNISFDWLKESLKCIREVTELEIFPNIKLSYVIGIFLIIPLVSWLIGWFK